jgi:hypothetical protein
MIAPVGGTAISELSRREVGYHFDETLNFEDKSMKSLGFIPLALLAVWK